MAQSAFKGLDGSQIQAFQLLALRGALKMECIGLRHSSGKRASVGVRKLGIKGRTKKELLTNYEQWLKEKGILTETKK